jgi:hypothetical protein
MNTIDFCYWLQGYFEVSGDTEISSEKVEIIKNHLDLVFKHEIDPLRESETTTPTEVLNQAHSPNILPNVPTPVGPIHTPIHTQFPNDPLVRC